jgi:hypothetical protein
MKDDELNEMTGENAATTGSPLGRNVGDELRADVADKLRRYSIDVVEPV